MKEREPERNEIKSYRTESGTTYALIVKHADGQYKVFFSELCKFKDENMRDDFYYWSKYIDPRVGGIYTNIADAERDILSLPDFLFRRQSTPQLHP